jgi:Spy/CpxP family protein refolding chaperone
MAVRTHLLVIAGLILLTPMAYANPGNEDNFAAGQAVGAGHPESDRPESRKSLRHHKGKKDEAVAKILNLTDEQKKQLENIRTKQKEGMKTVFEQMKSNREALDQEIIRPAPDMNKINELQNQLKVTQAQMIDSKLNAKLEIKKVLNHEQFVGLMTLERERKFRMNAMRGKGHFKTRGFGHGFKGGEEHASEPMK